ncbi:MAG: hypothetical protein AB7H80_00745 [Candidatus Kapaibacterium sp.]
MKREPYRLHDYFNRLQSREEITPAEFRSLVERVVEEGKGLSSKRRGIIMTAVVILSSLVLGGGLLWQTNTPANNAVAPKIVQTTSQETLADVRESRENSSLESVDNDRRENLSLSFQSNQNHEKQKEITSLKLLGTPWGYRLQPGQKLWYEYRVLETDPFNGDTTISIERACIEVQSVDSKGNLNLLFTATLFPEANGDREEKSAKDSTLLTKKYQATITPLGEFVAGKIVGGGEKEPVNVKQPELSVEDIQQEVYKWFPHWPTQEDFNKHFQAQAHREWLDTTNLVVEGEVALKVSRNQSADQYYLDSTSLRAESPTLDLTTANSNEYMYGKENQQELKRNKSQGRLTFSKQDGSVVNQMSEGSFYYSNQYSLKESFMKRTETMTIRSTSLHLINAEQAEESLQTAPPSIE